MNNTIPNVPRELMERVTKYCVSAPDAIKARNEVRALLSAPSPAGVDGCKCSMSISMLGDGCRHCQPQEYIDRLGEMLDEERSELSAAQAIIDGLRGENERIRLNIAEYNESIACYQSERDQQAWRIGELEGLLRHAQKQVPTGSGLHMRIDAALSAGKEGE